MLRISFRMPDLFYFPVDHVLQPNVKTGTKLGLSLLHFQPFITMLLPTIHIGIYYEQIDTNEVCT